MKIKKLYFTDKENGIEVKEIEFYNLNLLVGVSGAGKTTILKIIDLIKSIPIENQIDPFLLFLGNDIDNTNLSQIKFDILFTTNKNIECRWAFETGKSTGKKIKIINENIYYNNILKIIRNENEIKIDNIISPKLTQHKSILQLLEEDFINDIVVSLADINIFNEHIGRPLYFDKIDKFNKIDKLKKSNLNILKKLLITQEKFQDEFNCIKNSLISIFPNIQDVKFEKLKEDIYLLKFKENNKWISENNISSGMLKTLNFLAQIKLSNNESVLLIDEFENSLGVNCIDIVSDSLLSSNSNMQYIITSHHPYIINKIDMKYWKIVTRKGNVIQTKNISELNLPKSKHEAFKQLLNLKEFTEGISI